MINELKFVVLPYVKGRRCWSQKIQGFYNSYDIGDQVWEDKTTPLKVIEWKLSDYLKIIKSNKSKKERDAIFNFQGIGRFPVKAQTDFKNWNGVIKIDLDLNKSSIADKPTEYHKNLYNALIDNCLCSNNFYYIEHSSSGVGLHMFFYYNIEPTEENYFKCAKYTRDYLYSLDKNIHGFAKLLDEKSEKGEVFDPVYNRPFQKFYITGKDAYINDCSGEVSNEVLDIEIKKKETDFSHYELCNFDVNGEWEIHYPERLKIYTALKRVTSSKDECNAYWGEFCKHLKLYKDNTYNIFVKQFNYDGIDESTAHVSILEKYGIKIDKGITHYYLGDNEFLGDIRDKIVGSLTNGITFLQAGTGVGKTRCWTDMNQKIINDVLDLPYHRPILIVEPLNSIINTKYNEDVYVINGSKQFPEDLNTYGLYVTNYNKLIKPLKEGGYTIKDDIIEFLEKFELVIIDESHIILKDNFRSEVLVPFIESIQKAAESTKIILQTATPMGEELFFNIKNKIVVHKNSDKSIKLIYRKIEGEHFDITDINCLVEYYKSNKRKVYIYWNNASIRQLNEFKKCSENPERVAIYHKRNTGESSMEYIDNYHELGDKYDVLLSSVYFGVGNDLDDKCDAAVIIIGNNTWQEDIQAIGRWRNSKNIEVCQIILPNEIITDDEKTTSFNECVKKERFKLNCLWEDKNIKNKSVLIARKSYELHKETDIEYISVMKAAEIYNSLLYVKQNELENEYYGIRIKKDLTKPVLNNEDFTQKIENYWNEVKEIRSKTKQDIIAGKFDWDVIKSDSNISKFNKLWYKAKSFNLDKVISPKMIAASSNYNKINLFCNYYSKLINRNIDYAELYSLLWYRDYYEAGVTNFNESEIDNKVWYSMLAYLIFIKNKNVDEASLYLRSNYFKTFKWYCDLFYKMPNKLIIMFYETSAESEVVGPTMEFFNEDDWVDEEFENTIIHKMSDVNNYFVANHGYTNGQIENIISMCLDLNVYIAKEKGKEGGEISSPKKRCVVTNLNTNEEYEFDSKSEAQAFIGCNSATFSKLVKGEKSKRYNYSIIVKK